MKKVIVLLLFMCMHTSFLQALIGRCIEQGPETPTSTNYEKWHFVKCYHDCKDTLQQCNECKHRHADREQIIVNYSSPIESNTHRNTYPTFQKFSAYIAKKSKK